MSASKVPTPTPVETPLGIRWRVLGVVSEVSRDRETTQFVLLIRVVLDERRTCLPSASSTDGGQVSVGTRPFLLPRE